MKHFLKFILAGSLVKKSAVGNGEMAKLSLEIFLYTGKQKRLFSTYTAIESWVENVQYYFFKDYDNQKLNSAVFVSESDETPAGKSAGASKLELILKLDHKVVCKKQMHIDNH